MANSTTGLRLSSETKERLEILGKSRDRSAHYLMNTAIEQYLEKEEAIETERELVKSRWEKFELTGEILDHSDVTAWASGLNAISKAQSA